LADSAEDDAAQAVAVTDLADFRMRLPGAQNAAAAAGEGFEALYRQTSQGLLRDTARETFQAMGLLTLEQIAGYRPANGAVYPQTPLGHAMRQIALLVKADVGLEIAFAESSGWDTHVQQGTVNGTFARQARDLAQSIQAFWTDLGPAVTTDFRAVFCELAGKHLGIRNDAELFPGWTGGRLPLLRG